MAKREAKTLEKRKNIETPGWLLTFGDLNSLLLTFFVLLLSLSTIDRERTQKALISLESAFGVLPGTWSMEPAPSALEGLTRTGPFDFPAFRAHEYQRRVEEEVNHTDLGEFVDVESGPGGVLIRMRGEVLFEPGEFTPSAKGMEFLARVGDIVQGSPYDVFVQAHTDDRPIRNERVRDNWDLSARRATRVATLFQEVSGIEPGRIGAVGYADTRPLVPNTSEENRSRNRRVEILLKETRR